MTALIELREKLSEAARMQSSIKLGYEAAALLRAELADLDERRAAAADVEPAEHKHADWTVLGWDRTDDGQARVLQTCACGDVREVKP